MKIKPTRSVQERVHGSRLDSNQGSYRQYAGQVFAALYRCESCEQWWGSSELDVPEKRLLWRLVEPFSDSYLWVDYGGWRQGVDGGCCLRCGREAGEVVWPEGLAETAVEPGEEAEGESNPFLAYVSQSNEMEQHMAVIAAWEERRQGHAPGYTADISSLRCEMDRMRSAFKDVGYSNAALLPPGWRIMGDYNKWVKGQACARRNERASKVYNKDMLHDDRQQHAYPGGVR
jgi:hypothetical protein